MSTNIYLLLPSFSVDKGDSNVENAFFVNYAMPCFDFRALFHFLFDLHEMTVGESSVVYYYSGATFAHLIEMVNQSDVMYPSFAASLMKVMCNLDAKEYESSCLAPDDYEVFINGFGMRNNIVSEAIYRLENPSSDHQALLDIYATAESHAVLCFSHANKHNVNFIQLLKPSLCDLAYFLAHNRSEMRLFQHNSKHPIVSTPRPPIKGVSFLSCSQEVAQKLLLYAFGNTKLLCSFDIRVSNFKAFRRHCDIYWHAHDISEKELIEKGFTHDLLKILRLVAKENPL